MRLMSLQVIIEFPHIIVTKLKDDFPILEGSEADLKPLDDLTVMVGPKEEEEEEEESDEEEEEESNVGEERSVGSEMDTEKRNKEELGEKERKLLEEGTLLDLQNRSEQF